MRASGETAVASRIISPAPDRARWPRWIMCQSPAMPSVAEYWHIGAMMIRFAKRRFPIIRGSNSRLMQAPWIRWRRWGRMASIPSPIAALPLQHLDLVAVRVGHEEERRERPAVVVEALHGRRREAQTLEAPALGVQIVHREGEMPVTVAERIGLGAAVVDRQLKLEVGFGVAKIEDREVREREAVGDLQAERGLVEAHGPRLVADADHGVDRLRHRQRLVRWFRNAGRDVEARSLSGMAGTLLREFGRKPA